MEGNEGLKLEQTCLPLEQWDGADATARIQAGRVWGSISQLTTSPETQLILYVAIHTTNSGPLSMASWTQCMLTDDWVLQD